MKNLGKKRCFVGLGGAGINSIEPFIKYEKNADFLIIDNDTIIVDAKCRKIKANLHDTNKYLNHFTLDREYVFIFGLSYAKDREKAGVSLARTIALFLKENKKDFIMIFTMPFYFELGSNRPKILSIKNEFQQLANKVFIVDLDTFRNSHGKQSISIMDQFHYMVWEKSGLSMKKGKIELLYEKIKQKIRMIF